MRWKDRARLRKLMCYCCCCRERQVTEEEGRKWAEANNLYFIEASAKTASNVELVGPAVRLALLSETSFSRALLQAFTLTAATILENFDYVNSRVRKSSSSRRVSLSDSLAKHPQSKSECCGS